MIKSNGYYLYKVTDKHLKTAINLLTEWSSTVYQLFSFPSSISALGNLFLTTSLGGITGTGDTDMVNLSQNGIYPERSNTPLLLLGKVPPPRSHGHMKTFLPHRTNAHQTYKRDLFLSDTCWHYVHLNSSKNAGNSYLCPQQSQNTDFIFNFSSFGSLVVFLF